MQIGFDQISPSASSRRDLGTRLSVGSLFRLFRAHGAKTGCVLLYEVANVILFDMSRVEICSLAYEGKFNELKEKIDLKPSLATKIDEVRFRKSNLCYDNSVCFCCLTCSRADCAKVK